VRLGDLLDEVRDVRSPSADGGLPYVGLEHIGKGTLALSGVGRAADVTSAKKAFCRGDLLLGTLRPNFRKVARAPFNGVCSTDIAVLRPRLTSDASFALYVLASPMFIDLAARTASGARMPRASFRLLANARLPPLSAAERAAIGERLAPYDALIATNARRIETLEALARAVHQRWIAELGFPGAEPRADVGTPLGRLPRGWTSARLSDHVEEIREPVAPGALPAETPYFGLEHLPRRSTTLAAWGVAAEATSDKLRVRAGDILFSKIRPVFHKVAIAPVEGIASTDAVVLRPRRSSLTALVLGCVSSDAFLARAVASARGAKMPRADWQALRHEPLPLPPDALLLRYDALAGSAVKMASALGLQNRALAEARDLLLPRVVPQVTLERSPPVLSREARARPSPAAPRTAAPPA
jgi:type I restriction enzyme S subunit